LGLITPHPLVYIAGPYTHPDPVINVHRAIEVAEAIEKEKCAVIIPHLSMIWHLVRPADIDVWYSRDLEVLVHCHALVRFEGPSSGADNEVIHARFHAIPCFNFDADSMIAFKQWRAKWFV
jgi:hypothetical protein